MEWMIITITKDTIELFKNSWPGSGMPLNLDGITVAFSGNDLVDYEGFDADDSVVDLDGCSGLTQLFDDAKMYHTTRNHPQLIGPIRTY